MRTAASLVVQLVALSAFAQSPAEDAYPTDITPPAGTRYPCALTALPRTLPGIPEAERGYINRTYARILRATQAKLVALKAIEEGNDASAATSRYLADTAAIVERTRAEPPPAGLAAFQEDVVQALKLQQEFFRKAVPVRAQGGSMTDVYAIPEGRQASGRLIAAWGQMSARYPGWSADARDSIYHHLCALDLF
jgi:hypothetical protein